MRAAGTSIQTAWLFVRGLESVRLEVQRDAGGYRLDVWGPGRARAVHECEDDRAAMSLAEQYQSTLTGNGFVLQAYADRRTRSAASVRVLGAVDRRTG